MNSQAYRAYQAYQARANTNVGLEIFPSFSQGCPAWLSDVRLTRAEIDSLRQELDRARARLPIRAASVSGVKIVVIACALLVLLALLAPISGFNVYTGAVVVILGAALTWWLPRKLWGEVAADASGLLAMLAESDCRWSRADIEHMSARHPQSIFVELYEHIRAQGRHPVLLEDAALRATYHWQS